jgi:hypothetical protein
LNKFSKIKQAKIILDADIYAMWCKKLLINELNVAENIPFSKRNLLWLEKSSI